MSTSATFQTVPAQMDSLHALIETSVRQAFVSMSDAKIESGLKEPFRALARKQRSIEKKLQKSLQQQADQKGC